MNWQTHAGRLADQAAGPRSRWYEAISKTPRHLLVPRWWEAGRLVIGDAEPGEWMRAAYSDRTLITRLGPLHADQAMPDSQPDGYPTSSSTAPSLVIDMYRHGRLFDGADILDIGTGSGYGCGLLAERFGDASVTSVDVDPYLTEVAAQRLADIGLRPRIVTTDATKLLPGTFDRIVSMVSVKPIPEAWMSALRPRGRMVTVLANTSLILTATKGADGWAEGRIEWDRATFMASRTGSDYPSDGDPWANIDGDGDVTKGRYPLVNVEDAWELSSMLEITAPGITNYYRENDDGTRTAGMTHPDGSWARVSAQGAELPEVHQGGPRRLWDILDELRSYWLQHGYFQLHGAEVSIPPEGEKIFLTRGDWEATIT